jgi:hypothetical protein
MHLLILSLCCYLLTILLSDSAYHPISGNFLPLVPPFLPDISDLQVRVRRARKEEAFTSFYSNLITNYFCQNCVLATTFPV